MFKHDEDMTSAEWAKQERHDEAEQIRRDEEEHRFREDCEFCMQFDAEPYPLLNALHHTIHDAERGAK